ncbi:MAG: hypothetical protein R3A10_10665 [Caldilineaceae bacterium]
MTYARKEGEDRGVAQPGVRKGNGGDSGCVRFWRPAVALHLDADLLLVNAGLHDIKTDPRRSARQVPLDQYTANPRHRRPGRDAARASGSAPSPPCDERVHNRPTRPSSLLPPTVMRTMLRRRRHGYGAPGHRPAHVHAQPGTDPICATMSTFTNTCGRSRLRLRGGRAGICGRETCGSLL